MAILALLLVATLPAPAIAQEPAIPALTIETPAGQGPGAIHLRLEPGDRESLDLRFSVTAENPVAVALSLANVIAPPNGGFALAPPDAPLAEPASWIAFEPETLTLDPGEGVTRSVTVAVPGNAGPGRYVAALAMQTVDPVPIPGGDGIGQIVRAVLPVTVEVPGALEPAFTLGEPTLVQGPAGGIVQVPVANTGNVPLSPQGTLTLETPGGGDAATLPVTMGAVYTGGETVVEIALPELPEPGEYVLSLDLTDRDTGKSATIREAAITVPERAAEPEEPPVALVTFDRIAIEPDAFPMTSVDVAVAVANVGAPVSGATLTLDVSRNGQLVESAVIAEGVDLVDGVTSFATNYAPEEGFGSGLWSFRVRLETVDENGVTSLLTGTGTVRKIDVP